jgi:aldehyde:ferredoxin oxidoreductase
MFVYFFGDYHLPGVIEAVTGMQMSMEELLQAGGRIQTVRQMFNAREGAIRHEMPQRAVGSPPLKKGSAAGVSVDIETMVQGYYEGMGFKEDGVPTEATLESYGLDAMIPDLQICTGAPKRFINEYLLSDDSVKKGQKHRPSMGG